MVTENVWSKYIDYISVSQIKTHARNPRRWVLEKVLKLPTCSSPATELGSMVHDEFEKYGRGEEYDTESLPGRLWDKYLEVSAGGKFAPQDTTQFETELRMQTSEDLPPFLGYVDSYTPSKTAPVILDYKTSGSKKYFLTEDELLYDPQMVVYAYWALQQNPTANLIYLAHVQIAYKLKREPVAITHTRASRAHIEKQYYLVTERVRSGILNTLRQLDEGLRPLEMSTLRCAECDCSFGPKSCEFRHICQRRVTPEQYCEVYEQNSDKNTRELKQALTEYAQSAIIKSEEGDTMMSVRKGQSILNLAYAVRAARNKFGNIANTWDRREHITASVVLHVEGAKPDLVLLPQHFISGTVDPDYMPIITQLKEAGFELAVHF